MTAMAVLRAVRSVPPSHVPHAVELLSGVAAAAEHIQVARLSPRERDVVRLMARGVIANKQIALELGISRRTVEIHRGNARAKLKVGSTGEMVRIGILGGGNL